MKNQNSIFKQTEIGMIPEDWKFISLKNVCSKIGSGITPRGAKKVYKINGIALIRSQNIYNNHFSPEGLVYVDKEIAENMKQVTVFENDILLNITGDSVARCCMVKKEILPARVNQHVSIVRTKKEILNSKFLQYYLTTKKMQNFMLGLAQSGGTRNALTKGMIQTFVIPLPSEKEQSSIAKILSDLDAKIELNHQMNKTLEAIGQAIFKHWFINFEFPNEEGKPYKSSGGEMVYNEEIEKEIPKGWEVKENIRAICEKINYGYTQSASEEDIGPKFVRVTDINKGDWIIWSSVPHCKIENKDIEKYRLERGDIIVARMADPGKIAIYESGPTAVFASYLIRVRPKNGFHYYLYYLMKSTYYQNYILGASTGSVQKSLNARGLTEGLSIFIPHNEVIGKFNDVISNLRMKLNKNVSESQNLSQIRDSLLPKLMSGKIKVPVEVMK